MNDAYFMMLAEMNSAVSLDTTKVGAVIVKDNDVLVDGHNRFPDGVARTRERVERPAKYAFTVHAETSAITHAAKAGVSILGSTLYCTHHPCLACTPLIIASGISRVIYGQGQMVMDGNFELVRQMFGEAGVICEEIKDDGR